LPQLWNDSAAGHVPGDHHILANGYWFALRNSYSE
jgi:hypothetical protein